MKKKEEEENGLSGGWMVDRAGSIPVRSSITSPRSAMYCGK